MMLYHGEAPPLVAACQTSHSVYMYAVTRVLRGWNQYGQLGHGNELDVAAPKRIDFLHGKSVVELKSAGPWCADVQPLVCVA